MARSLRRAASALSLVLLSAGLAQAQFVVLNEDDDNIEQINNGGTLRFESEGVGGLVTKRIEVTFTGVGNARLTVNQPTLQGSTAFTLSGDAGFPATLDPEDTADFFVRFNPSGIGPFSSRLTLTLDQSNPLTGRTTTTTFLINLEGVVADYTLAYQLPGGNETPVGDGGTIPFEETEIDTSSTATIIVTNRGSGPGTVESVAIDGGGVFEASGLQLLPVTVNAGGALRYSVTFSPEQLGQYAGSMSVQFGQGSSSVSLQGQAVAPAFSFSATVDGSTTELADRGTLSLPSTPLGEEIEARIRVVNNGTLEGVIPRITVAGSGFSLAELPILPATLEPSEELSFVVRFTPQEPGTNTGQLQVGDALFNLEGVGAGAELTYRSTSTSGSVGVEAGDSIVFPPTSLGGSSQSSFEILNGGDEAQTITLISASGDSFSLSGVPSLPVTIPANGSATVTIEFEPAGTGLLTGSLRVDGVSFPLSGVGEDPPELSAVTIEGGGGEVEPASQVVTGVSIAEPYPVDLLGDLTLTFESDAFANDPSVQFARGGRTVPFTIFAGETQAVFPNGSTQARFQTGTVAGTIILDALFAVDGANVDVTPDTIPFLAFTVSEQAPQLIEVTFNQFTNTGFSIFVTGYSTSRGVDSLTVNLQGTNLDTSSLEIPVRNQFNAWYASNQSTSFGSQFTATVNFTVDGVSSDVTSVSVSASNAFGSSDSVSVTLPAN